MFVFFDLVEEFEVVCKFRWCCLCYNIGVVSCYMLFLLLWKVLCVDFDFCFGLCCICNILGMVGFLCY